MASSAAAELAEMSRRAEEIKAEIQKEAITVDDVQALRSIEPKRKSVQNMLENEVAQTPKFEKLLNEEMGEKSAYEMRSGNNEWRNDETKTVPIINVQKREIPENLADLRKQNDIPRGTFINKDTGIEIQFSRKSINEIVAKAIPDAKRDIPVEARLAALYQMEELIENSVCFDSRISEYDPVTSKNKSPNSLFIHRMHGILEYEGKTYLSNLSVEESYITDKENNFNGTSKRLYSFRDIEITPVDLLGDQAYGALQNASQDPPSGVTTITIPQLYNIVKTFDQYFFENREAPGRIEREAEIKAQEEYNNAVVKFKEHKNELSTRVNDEYRNFINGLKKETPDMLVEAAAEIADKEKIRQYLEDYTPTLSDEQYEALLSRSNPLDEIYEQWVKNGELNSIEDVSIALEETADRILISLDRENSRSEEKVNAVLAVSQNDTSRYYVANNVSVDDVREAIASSDKLFTDLCSLGEKQITEAQFAEYSQRNGVTAVDVNIDEQTMRVYGADKPIVSFNDIKADFDEIAKELDLKNNTITFSVVTIEGEKPLVIGSYIDEEDITALEEYQDYIYDTGRKNIDVTVDYYTIGMGDNESYGADTDEKDYISEHLDEVLKSKYTDRLESETYFIATPAELLEEISGEAEEKNYLFTVVEFEDGSRYILPGEIDDNNIKDTEAWKEVKQNNFDIDSIADLDEDIRVTYSVYQTGSGEAVIPTADEISEIKDNIDDVMSNAAPISSDDSSVRPWTDVDDILYQLENTWKERHANEPNVSDGFDNSNFLYPKNLMRTAHDSAGKDHYNLDDSIVQIKLSGSEWLHPVDAAVEMNRRGVNIDDIEMLSVRYVSSDGTVGEKDLTPEQYIVYRSHTEERTTAFLAAVNAAEERKRVPEEMMNIIYNDMPSFVKSAVAWDELMEYDGIYDRLNKGEDPIEVAKSYLANQGTLSWNAEELKDGYFTWSVKDKGATADISVSVKDNITFREMYNSHIEVSWSDIADAFKKRIEQELNYNKLSDKTINVTAVGEDRFRFVDSSSGIETVESREELTSRFANMFNKSELDGIIKSVIENAPYEKQDISADNSIENKTSDNSPQGNSEPTYTNVFEWKEIPESIDADTGKPTLWSTEINSESYGRFIWISMKDEHSFDIEYANGDKFLPVSENSTGFYSMADAAEWAENNLTDILSAPKKEQQTEKPTEQNGTYTIYQIPSGDRYRDIRYESMEHLNIMGQLPDRLNYAEVYTGKLNDIKEENKLDGIFVKFNMQRPDDFEGRSLSVSDVVVIENDEGKKAYFVDDIGYKDITDIFLDLDRKEQTAEKLNIYDYEDIRLVNRSEWNDRTLGDDENPAFEEIAVSCTPNEDGSFTKYAYNTTNSNSVDVWEEENSISGDEMLEDIANHLKNMGQDNGNRSYHIELTDHDGNVRTLDNSNFEFYQDKSSFAIDRAKNYIKEFLDSEYSSTADFSDMEHISIGYTEIGSEEQGDHSLQMEADLVNYAVNYYIDDELAKSEKYDSLEQMNRDHLSVLSFEDMLYVGTTELDRILEEKPELESSGTAKRKSGSDIEVGDKFLYNDREYTVTSEKGIYPDDVGVSYEENTGGISYQTTQNIDRYKLADNAIFLGNPTKEQQKENSPQGNPKAEKEKSSEKSFSEQVDEVLNGTARRYKSDLMVCNTPEILLKAGCRQLPMMYTRKHLLDAVHNKSKKNPHFHGIAPDLIKRIPELIQSPVMVFDSISEKNSDSIVMVLDAFDNDKNPLIMSVKPNGQGVYELKHIEANFITSIYGKDRNFAKYIERVTESNSMIFWDKNKSQELFRVLQLQLPQGVNNLDSNVIIHQSRNIVNTQNEISSQKTVTEPQTENSPQGNSKYNPKINDIIEYQEQLYRISDITGDNITLEEADNLIPKTRFISLSSLLGSDFSVIEESKETAAEKPAEEIPVQPQKTEPEKEKISEAMQAHPAKTQAPKNFIITDENFGVSGGAKARYTDNVEAIKTLKVIEAENRTATPDEQQILSKYTGWGAIPQAFDSSNDKWDKEYTELKELLTPDEYKAARESTMNAHYTSPTVISAIYDGLKKLGFENGKILEPAMGIGNFFGVMPESMRGSELHGVELDSLTGRIAQQLYPNAEIKIKGYESTYFPDNSFDVAVGNVPFGSYKLNDDRYNDNKFLIHDYFFAKTLDKVRPGGVIAFVTSKGTMDKENSDVRRYIAERAELLGAIRLPNNAFEANAGTEVTSDIIFLQKRETPIEIDPDKVEWLNKAENPDGLSINNYFVQHPEMVLGEIVEGNKLYGRQTNDTTCIPIEGADLKQQLAEAVRNIKGTYTSREADKTQENSADIIEAPENMPKFSYAVVDNKLYFHESGPEMYAVKASKDRIERAAAMIELRTVVKELLDLQSENINGKNDNDISDKRKELNARYDSFTEKYGNISDKKNAQVLKGDAGYTLVSELEVKDEQGNVTGKADIFTKNTVRPNTVITHADSPEEALIISVAEKGKVDFDCMTEITGMSKESLISALTETGQIYRLPQPEEKYVTADEYLTGNIRIKLEQARNAPAGYDYSRNIAALESAMPKPLRPQDITAKLGSHWIAPEYIRQFILEKIQPPFYSIGSVQVEYSSVAGVWKVSADASAKNSRGATKIYGTDRMHAFEIIDKILNNGTLQVKDRKTDENGDYIRDQNDNYVLVVNEEETKAVKVAADKIKSDFQDWIFKDPERRDILVQKYNDMYNSIRQREYDGSHLSFAGMNPAIELKEHQKNAVARALYGGNTLLAHAVGAGKTFEMIAIAMEGKRLGLHNKAMIAVPNALTEQEGADFRKLYPNAKVLVATEKDFEKKNRQKLFSKIANNDWDAVIVGHSQFDRIGISKEREAAYINKELDDMREALAKAKQSAVNPKQSFSVKAIERTIKSYETRLQSILDAQEKEDFIDFEELGCDKLFIDESHLYKNLATATKMSNIAGVSTNGSQRAAQLLMKCKYLDELTDHKGVIFASGTPVSNSMTEMYTLMRYLQSDVLEDAGIKHFDEWAADFGEVKTDFELKPESDGKYQMKTRFAHFTNVPELMNMFKECADIRTADTLNLEGKPNAHVHDIVAQPSKAQKKFVKQLGKRAEKIRSGNVDPRKDNMLCITNDGRKIGLDERLIDPNMPDNPGSKVNLCVQNVLDIYNRTSEQRSTQCIFCDMSTPKSEARQDKFIVYRPSAENESGFEIARKKVGLGKLNDFDSIKTYINKNSTEEADKLHEGDIVVIRRPDENMENILSEAAVYKDGKLIPGGEELLNTVTLSAIEPMPPKEFNVYDDIKDKLIAQGVPEKEIAFIHDYQTADEKQQLFKQMNAGDVRILLGSTQKCGAGMNAQRRMIALHHLDAPLRPSDMEQRNGRIDRQGNENKDVDIYRYVTDKTFDAYLYQILENKQKFISQVMTSKTPERVCADIDEQALDYAEVKSLCAGNPLIKEQMLLTAEIRDLKMEKGRFNEQIYDMQDKIRTVYPNKIKENDVILKHNRADYELAQNAEKIITEDGKTAYPITVCGQTYTDKKEGGAALAAAAKDNISKLIDGKNIEVGEYRGMKISIFYDSMMNKTKCDLYGEKHHYLELNPDTDIGNVIRLDNCIANIEKMCRDLENENNVLKSDLENMKVDVMKPFPKAEQLAAAEERLTVVLDELTRFSITDNSAAKDLYERLCETFPDIMNGNAEHERYTAGECFDPLVVEMHEDMLYMAHTHIQNGDVMNDPLIVFQIKDEAAVPICFENSGMGIYEEHRTDEMTESAASWRSDVLDFTDEWLDNIEQQGYSMEKPEMQAEKTEKSYSYDR